MVGMHRLKLVPPLTKIVKMLYFSVIANLTMFLMFVTVKATRDETNSSTFVHSLVQDRNEYLLQLKKNGF